MGICITGIGAISAAGLGPTALWEAAVEARPAGSRREYLFNGAKESLPVAKLPVGALQLPEFPGASRLDRGSQMGLVAGLQAWHQAGLDRQPPHPRRVAVAMGTSRGPVDKWEEARQRSDAGKRQLPSLAATGTIAALSGSLAHLLEATGPCLTLSATCASAAAAIAQGASQIAGGMADIAVVGGAEAPLSETVIGLMRAANLLGSHEDPKQACRPFDRTRNGLVAGEAAGVLILERTAAAKARGATPLARLSGWASGLSHSGKTGVDEGGDGLAEIIAEALAMAKLTAADIGYLNTHGTGTLLNDLAESKAIRNAFGSDLPAASSTKPITGHCLGATPALEAMICLKAMEHQIAPPSANCDDPDPAIDVDLVRGEARPTYVQHAMSTSLGFWGNHAALVFSKI